MDAAKLDLCVLLLWNLHAGNLRRPTLYAKKAEVSTFIEKLVENSRVRLSLCVRHTTIVKGTNTYKKAGP